VKGRGRPKLTPAQKQALGDDAEAAWRKHLLARGHTLIPLCRAEGNNPGTMAPMIAMLDTLIRAPDFMVIHKTPGGVLEMHEVKAKTGPGLKDLPYRHWQYGIDLACLEDYRRAQKETGIPVRIVFRELYGPKPEDVKAPPKDPALIPSGAFFTITVEKFWMLKTLRPHWPHRNGRGSVNLKGGAFVRRNQLDDVAPQLGLFGWQH